MKTRVLLYADGGGEDFPYDRFDQVIAGMKKIQDVLDPNIVRPFTFQYHPGYALKPFSEDMDDTIIDSSVTLPQSRAAEIVIGITERKLQKKQRHPSFVDGVANIYKPVSVITSRQTGGMLVSLVDANTGATQSTKALEATTAHGGFQLITGESACPRPNCLGNERFEGGDIILGFWRRQVRPRWIFCNDTQDLIRTKFPKFFNNTQARLKYAPDDL